MKFKKNDRIDIIAPASVPKKEDYIKGIRILEDWGFIVNFPSDSISPWTFHAHDNLKRAELLKSAFQNSSSKIVWSLRGGYGTQKLMPSFKKIKIKNKLLIGFSDITALHLYLNGVHKIPSLHAPSICELPYLSEKELVMLHKILFEDDDFITIKNLKSLNNTKMKNITGTLIGGNLTVLQMSLGTPWFPSLHSKILFLEDVNEADYRIDRALHHLYFSGALKGVKALVFGYLTSIKKAHFEKIIKSFSHFSNCPVFYQIPAGHQAPNLPLPLGTKAEISLSSSQGFNLKIRQF